MILIDPPVWPWRGRLFSHLASDTSIEELHDFATRLGIPPAAYDGDHYDVPAERRDEVIAAGARPVSQRELLMAVQEAGLRFRKRRGERPLASVIDGLTHLPTPHRVEVLLSARTPPGESTIAAVAFVRDRRGQVLLVRSPARGGWEAPGGWREPGEDARACAVRELAEETGLLLRPDSLSPFGYERIRFLHPPSDPRLHPQSHVAVYAAVVGESTSAAVEMGVGAEGVGPEGQELVWVDSAGAAGRCAHAPWWPLLWRFLQP